MIYVVTGMLLVLMHVIYYYGVRGNELALKFEKFVVFVAAVSLLWAIYEFSKGFDEFSALYIYPAGMVFFILMVLIVFPKPIKNSDGGGEEIDL